jgi:hypothetical protein
MELGDHAHAQNNKQEWGEDVKAEHLSIIGPMPGAGQRWQGNIAANSTITSGRHPHAKTTILRTKLTESTKELELRMGSTAKPRFMAVRYGNQLPGAG